MNEAVVIKLNARKLTHNNEEQNLVNDFLHDINSPLQALKALSQVAGVDAHKREEIFDKCMLRIEGLAKRNNKTAKQKEKSLINLVTLFEEIKQFKLIEKNISLSSAIKLTSPWIMSAITSDTLLNILSNLVNNSLNAKATSVRLVAKRVQNKIHLEITDNGCGLNSQILEKIGCYGQTFTKGGSGIGLATTIKELQEIGGQIMCRSIPNQITQFTIILPL